MNYVALLVWSVIGLFILWLIFTPFAEAYEMDMIVQWEHKPNICIWDNKYNNLFQRSIEEWNKSLSNQLGEHWILLYMIVDKDTPVEIVKYCHINMILVESELTKNNEKEYAGVLGRTSFVVQDNKAFAVVYEERDAAHYFNFDDAIVKTAKHELGHAFGLGHWEPENAYEGLRPWPATLMFGTSDKYYNGTVDNYSLAALHCWYGDDGWGGVNERICDFIQKVQIPKLNYTPYIVNFTFTL